MAERKTRQGVEKMDWDSYPKFGRWYYMVPFSILAILVIIDVLLASCNYVGYFWYRYLGHNWGDCIFIDNFIAIDFASFLGYSSFGYNFFLWIFYPKVRSKKRIVYKKDPVRLTLRNISIINCFLIPVLLVLPVLGPNAGYYNTFGDDLFLCIIAIFFLGWVFVFPLLSSVFDRSLIDLLAKDASYSRSRSSVRRTSSEWPEPNNSASQASRKRTYIGSNGEFERNDRERAYNEDIHSFRQFDKNFDASEHFGWEHELNYDSEGYRDEE